MKRTMIVAAVVVMAVWLADYRFPQRGIKAASFPQTSAVITPIQRTLPEI